MTVDEIRELIQLATETGIAELEVQRGENRVRIRRGGAAGQEIVVDPPVSAASPIPQLPQPHARLWKRRTIPTSYSSNLRSSAPTMNVPRRARRRLCAWGNVCSRARSSASSNP